MGKENYGINSDSMLAAASSAGQVANKVNDAGSSMRGDFANASDLNGEAVGTIANQLSMLGTATSSWQRIMTTNVNKGLEYNSRMADVAGDIEIPLDYTTNNAMDTNKYNAVFISKTDSKSVNEGEETEKVSDIDESTVAAESLFNMNEDKTKQQEYDDSTVIEGQSILGNINNNETEAQEYDDSTSVGNKKLKDISGNTTEQQNYDGNSSIRSQNLSNIAGDQTQQQEYDDSTVIGKSILGNINSDNQTQQQEIDDDAIAAAVAQNEASNKKEEDEEKQVVA